MRLSTRLFIDLLLGKLEEREKDENPESTLGLVEDEEVEE